MSTYDLTFGAAGGLQMQASAMNGVNFFEVDFAEVKKLYPALAGADIITVGLLPKGAMVHGITAETLAVAQAGTSTLTVQDDTATPVVILSGHDPLTAGALSGPGAGTALFFGGGTATGLHNVLVTAQKKINILLGATPPTQGKVRIAVDMSLMSGF